jgi:hypothetical protein
MKKFWLSLGLTLFLTCCWCGAGYYGLGTGPAFGQDYYSAPYADPLTQLLYYLAPPVQDQYYQSPQRYQRQETSRERKDRERYERQQTKRARQETKHERQDREHQGRGQGRGQGY